MRFSLSVIALATSASAILVARDLSTIQNVLNGISSDTDALTKAVQGFSSSAQPVIDASTKLVSDIKAGITTVSGTSPLTETDAVQLTSYVQGLNTSIANSVNDVIAKKPAFVSANQAGTVLQALKDQKASSDILSSTITSKVPTGLQGLASQLSSGISASLQRAIDAYAGSSSSAPSSTTGGSNSTISSSPSPPVSKPTSPASSNGAAVGNAPAHLLALLVAVLALLL